MHSFVTSKNVKWCHLIWPTLYVETYLYRRPTGGTAAAAPPPSGLVTLPSVEAVS